MRRLFTLIAILMFGLVVNLEANAAETTYQILTGQNVTYDNSSYTSHKINSWFDNKGTLTLDTVNVSNNKLLKKASNGSNHSAVYNNGGTLFITGNASNLSTFIGNQTITNGGAISNITGVIKQIEYTSFTENQSKYGGAIYSNKTGVIDTISNTKFIKNTASISGGAIYSNGLLNKIENSEFTSNEANGDKSAGAGYGGAIYAKKDLTIINSVFKDNSAYRKGGAIAMMGGDLTIIAQDTTKTVDVNGNPVVTNVSGYTEFSQNTQGYQTSAATSNDIYMGGSSQNLYLISYDVDSEIKINSGIDFNKGLNIYINKPESSLDTASGKITIGGNVGSSSKRANFYLYGGTMSFINNQFNDVYANKVTLSGDTTLGFDVDLTTGLLDYDTFNFNSVTGVGKFIITSNSFNIISGLTDESDSAVLTLLRSSSAFKQYINMYDENGNKTNIIYIYDKDGTTKLYKVKLASNGSLIFSNVYYIDKETNPLVYAVNYTEDDFYNLVLSKNITVDSWEDIDPGTPRNKLLVNTLIIDGKNKTITAEDNLVGMDVDASNNDKFLTVNNAIFIGFKNAITNNGGIVTLNNVSFKSNYNEDVDSYGSALSNISGIMSVIGSKKKSKSIFQNNRGINGGAIYNSGEMEISYTTFGAKPSKKATYSNIATNGGAIYNTQSDVTSESTESGFDTNLKVVSSSFVDNTATLGGAIYNEYGDDGETSTSVSIASSTFTHNNASDKGGAIYNKGNLLALNSTFGNKSKKTSYANTANYGGAVANVEEGKFYSLASNYYYNTATNGGAIYNTDNGKVNISGGIIANNTAEKGGAIFNDTDATLSLDAYMYLYERKGTVTPRYTYLTVSGNSAVRGGAIYNLGTLAPDNFDDSGMPRNISGDFKSNKATVANQSYKINHSQKEDETVYETPLGGAIYNEGTLDLTNITFTSNSSTTKIVLSVNQYASGANLITEQITKFAGKGGAIYSNSEKEMYITNATFSKNTAAEAGGAICNENSDSTLYVTNSDFVSNSAKSTTTTVQTVTFLNGTKYKTKKVTTKENIGQGGAISTTGKVEINTSAKYEQLVDATTFRSNSAEKGGAIYAEGAVNGKLVNFNSNKAASGAGGAIYSDQDVTMEDATFTKNNAKLTGGAIHGANVSIQNGTFSSNKSSAEGGAIYATGDVYINAKDYSSDDVPVGSTTFTSNSSTGNGGAIYSSGTTLVKDATFTSNSSKAKGGAIYSAGDVRVINSTFNKNSAQYGGALFVEAGKTATLINTSLTNNKASQQGGAIYADEGSTVNIIAYNRDVLISGNKAGGKANSIYLNNATLFIDAYGYKDASGREYKYTVTLSDGVTGEGYSYLYMRGNGILNITSNVTNLSYSDKESNGSHINIDCESYIKDTSFSLSGKSTVGLANNNIATLSLRTLTLADNTTSDISIDMDLKGKTSDKITAEKVIGTGTLNVSKVNMTTNSKTPVDIKVGEGSVVKTVTANKAESAEATYKLRNFVDENGMLRTVAYGQKAKPCAVAAPVAAQLGGYLTQINSYDQAFMNMDMNMLQPYSERVGDNANNNAIQNRYSNRYASTDESYTGYSENNGINYNSKGLWTRPYATFERVNLSGGPKVNNIAYGNFFGGDADIKYMNNGWSRQFSAYIGYNGSTQDYVGQSIDQNGGNIGLTEVWYKNNFFTGLTLNVGANVAQASTDIGRENIPMLMAGLASKSGYNFEFKNGKFIIQPSLLLSYTFVHSFSHENGRGSHIGSSPLNAIQVVPGLKFIFNLPKGWQPYLGVNMRWNIIDKTHFSMQDVTIPDMSIDPYVEYGIGVQRKWGERFTGYGQAMIRNGGRNGVMLSFGFKWALGK